MIPFLGHCLQVVRADESREKNDKMRNAMMNVHGTLRGALDRGYQLSYGSMRRLAGSPYDRLAQE